MTQTSPINTEPINTDLTVAVGQFDVVDDWQINAAKVEDMIQRAVERGVDLLVLPEGVMARFMDRRERIREAAQSLEGPFVSRIRAFTRDLRLTVIFGIHETSDEGRPYNTLVALRAGELISVYRKLHLYDAFSDLESAHVRPGDELPPLVDVAGYKIGLMTCYDLRFPELARLLALQGAHVIALPAAWAKGFGKERQWATLVSARALDNTVYVLAAGESGDTCIGSSIIADPLGQPMTTGSHDTELTVTTISADKLQQVRKKLPVLEHIRFTTDTTPRLISRVEPIKESI